MTINKIPFFDPMSFSLPKQFNTTIGFEPILKRLSEMSDSLPKIPTYPPYNIRQTGENTYVIEIAVAGFGRQDLELELEDGKLTVKGNIQTNDTDDNYIFKGIADRAFTRQFILADTVEIKNADLINGMLKVWLERFIPEDKKPKKINIGDEPKTESKKELLNEDGNTATKEYLQDRSEK
jgi:molecular chaperone IbpA